MDAFSYTDIFSTKGIEYLVVIGFLLFLIPLWMWFSSPLKSREIIKRAAEGLSFAGLSFPAGLNYNRNHTWSFMEPAGGARIGVDDLLLHMTGGVSVEFLKKEGEKIEKGELLFLLKDADRSLRIASPLSGEVLQINEKLQSNAVMLNNDPYKNGWLYRIDPKNWKEDASCCKSGEEVADWEKEELQKCKEFFAGAAMADSTSGEERIMQEGGELIDFPLQSMPGDIWSSFQQKILE